MAILRTLFIIWLFWWLAQKLLNFFGKKVEKTNSEYNPSDRTQEFKQRNMDVQDAEFEELDEGN